MTHMVKPHMPPRQLATALAGAHGVPQAPQLPRSVRRFRSQPSIAFMLQSPKPILHMPMPHTPALHPAVAFAGTAQAVPHLPQLLTSVPMAVSQPSIAFMLQSAKPITQPPTPHAAFVHTAAPV